MENDRGLQLTIGNLLKDAEIRHPDREIVYGKERYSYSKFGERARRIASGLLNKVGVHEGDVVAVLDWDSMRYMEAYFAVPMAGAVLHTVNIRYPPEVLYYTMAHAEDKYVIVRDEFLPMLEKYAEMFEFVKGWIICSDSDKEVKTSLKPFFNYNDLVKSEQSALPDVTEDRMATLFYTSGTTGMPKGVTFTHKQIVLHAMSLQMAGAMAPLNNSERDVVMPLVPMFHVHSWGLPYNALFAGMKYVLPGRYDFPKLLETIDREKVTFTASVPSILYMLLSAPNIAEHAAALKGLKMLIGGSALPRGLATKAHSLGMVVVGAYGLSETCPALTISVYNERAMSLPEGRRQECLLTAGIPFPFVQVRIVDSNFRDVPADGKTAGEVIARAPWCTSGYFKDPEKTDELWARGWLHTGDIGVRDELGYFQIVDREKDAVKSGGEFIPSLLLESAISECPGVGEVAVIGVEDPKWGERPYAVMTRSGEVTDSQVVEHLKKYVVTGRIQDWWIPDGFEFVESIPKTSTGKADKKELRGRVRSKVQGVA